MQEAVQLTEEIAADIAPSEAESQIRLTVAPPAPTTETELTPIEALTDVHERPTLVPDAPPSETEPNVHERPTLPAPADEVQTSLDLCEPDPDDDGYDLPLCPFIAGVNPRRTWEPKPRPAASNDVLPPNHDPATITGTTVLGVYVKEYLGRSPKSNRHLFRIVCKLCGQEGEREGRQIVRQRQPGCGCRLNTRHDLERAG